MFRYSWLVISFYFLLAILGGFYTVNNLGINSDTSEMFDDQLLFRKLREHYKQTFPQTEDNFVIVVNGEAPEIVSFVADSIAGNMKQQEHLFEWIYQPTGEDFFKKNQLLFLDSTALLDLSIEMHRSRTMMSFMAENYSLKGLFSFLGLMVRFSSTHQLEGMTPLFSQMDSVVVTVLQGREKTFSWYNLMGDAPEAYNANYSFIQVKPVLDYSKFRPAKPAIEEARRVIERYRNHDVKIRITGKKAMTYEEMGSVTDGAIQASVLALVMVSLVLWLGLRSFRLIAATLITLIVGLVLTAAFSAWTVGHLNMISVAFAVLYIGLGVDYAIHICLRYRELGKSKVDPKSSITLSIRDVGPALWLSTLSTSIGFYSFVPTDFSGVSELGIIAGTGMFISLLVTLTLLPCLIWKFSLLSTNKTTAVPQIKGPQIEAYRKQIRVGTIVLALVAVWLLPKTSFDYDPINLRDPSSESVSTARELMELRNFSPWSLNILARDSLELAGISDELSRVAQVDRVINIYKFIPTNQVPKLQIIDSMRHALSPMPEVPFELLAVPQDEQYKAIEDFEALLSSPRYEDISVIHNLGQHLKQLLDSISSTAPPDNEQYVRQLQSNLLSTLPYTVSSLKTSLEAGVVNLESLPENLRQQWIAGNGVLRIQVFPSNVINSNQEMRDFASVVQGVSAEATGDLTVTIASGDTVVKAFKQAILTALLAIGLLLLVYLRNLKDTLFILLPLLLAGVFTIALTVVFDIDFNFANIIALPLLLGLGVDNGVHIVHRAKTDQNGKGLLQTSTARAILFSSLTTLFSFGNLAFSPHRGTASMGLLLTVGVVFVVIATLVVLPAFLPKQRT